MSQAFRILVSADYYDQFLERFQALGRPHYSWERVSWPERDQRLPDLMQGVDAIISRLDLEEHDYLAADKLKLFQVPTAGYDHIDLVRAARHGVPVANNGGANAISVAEHVFMLVLCLYRRLLLHHNAVVKGPWINRKYENTEMYGKRLGIVGLGNVGRQLAMRARCFGMHVAFNDICEPDPDFVTRHQLQPMDFDELLATSDIVSFHVPLTPLTENMINSRSLKLMRKGALLINTSRGRVQDEDALSEALASGHLGGAGIDVFRQEPVPADSPLLHFENVVLTPHNGPSRETQDRVLENMTHNIMRVEQGLEPEFLVRPAA